MMNLEWHQKQSLPTSKQLKSQKIDTHSKVPTFARFIEAFKDRNREKATVFTIFGL